MSYFKPKISHCLSYCCGHPLPPPPPPPPPHSSIFNPPHHHHHHYCSHHQNLSSTYLQMLPRLSLHLQWLLSFACFLAFLQKLSKDRKKKHCWMCELLFIRPAKCLYRVPCTLQKHNILYDCMWKQIKLPSKWRCCWIRVSRRSCCWSCKIKCHEKSLNCCKIILKQYTNLLLWKTQKFLTGIEIKIV